MVKTAIRLIVLLFAVVVCYGQLYLGADSKINIRNADSSRVADSVLTLPSSVLILSDSSWIATHWWTDTYFMRFSDSTGHFLTPTDTIVIAGRIPDSSKVLFWTDTTLTDGIATDYDLSLMLAKADTGALVMTISDSIPLHNQIVLKLNSADTAGTAYRTWVSSLFNPYVDSVRVKVLDGAKADSGTVVYWADTTLTNGVVTNYDLSLKANLASPTFTGTVTIPQPFTIGAVSMTADATELNVLDGITSTVTELNYTDGVTSNIQTQLNATINRRYAYFFFDTATETATTFIYDAGGTKSAATRGYPAIRAGSITGVSIQANCSAYTNSGTITADVWVNGSSVYQVATAAVTATGLYQAQGTQAAGTDAVAAGNIIAAKVLWTATFSLNYICMTVEFESTN